MKKKSPNIAYDSWNGKEHSNDNQLFDQIEQELSTPCEPLNAPLGDELKNFKIESVPTDPAIFLGMSSKTHEPRIIVEEKDIFGSIPCDPTKLIEDPAFSAILQQASGKEYGKLIQIPEKKLDRELDKPIVLSSSTPEELSQEQKLSKHLKENFKKLSSTKEFKRTHEISVRVDGEEKKKIEERAKQFGFANTSDYVRFVTINAVLFAGIDLSKRN